MFRKLVFNIIIGIGGIFLAIKLSQYSTIKFIYGIIYNGPIKEVVITGLILGIVNFLIRPLIRFISFPLRIITFNLFSLIIDIGLVWLVVGVFSPIKIEGIIPLFWLVFIIKFLSLIFNV